MRTIPVDSTNGEPSRERLLGFLRACREAARADREDKVASISLQVQHIDPLAVLEAIYEPAQHHFYIENPARGEAVAGAEALLSATSSGPDRFREVERFARSVLARTIAVGEVDSPFGGPHFFCGFAFSDAVEDGARFAPATVFVPRWQVSRQGGYYGAVANVLVGPDDDLDPLADRVWRAHEKFSAFGYEAADHPLPPVAQEMTHTEVGGGGSFEAAVGAAIGAIGADSYEKIVLARAVDLGARQPFHPLDSLDRLRRVFPGCFSFSFSNQGAQSFIGATPERLLRVEGREILTEALAGSAPRGATAREDAQLAGALLGSEKDLREHRVVIDSIARRLRALGIDPEIAPRPELLQLSNVQHLRSPVRARLPDGLHLLDVLAALHPTPAVGGTPREAALPAIPQLEKFCRGLYAGALGWFDHRGHGEFVVAIRSALIDARSARAYAGAGIVRGSDPQKELRETDLKLAALLENLR